jgi:hypothetical protein
VEKSIDLCAPIDADNRESAVRWNPFLLDSDPHSLPRLLATLLVSLSLSFAVSWLVRQLPLRDPIEVVGKSLLEGNYSERAEHASFAAFLAMSLLCGAVLSRSTSLCASPVVRILLSAVAWLALIVPIVLTDVRSWASLILSFVASAAAGWIDGQRRTTREEFALPLFLCAAVAWGYSYESQTGQLGNPPTVFVMIVVMTTIGLAITRWRSPAHLTRAWPYVATAALAAVAWMESSHSARNFLFVLLCGATCFLAYSKDERRRAWNLVRPEPWWTVCFVSLATIWLLAYRPTPGQLALLALRGILAGLVARIGWPTSEPSAPEGFIRRIWQKSRNSNFRGALSRLSDRLPICIWIAPVLLIPLIISHSWFGSVLTVTTLALLLTRRRIRGQLVIGLSLMLAMALAGLPKIAWPEKVDAFHDGQILSAVWEFEQGRALYSEVFPLRGTEFFAAWLSRMFSPHTLAGSMLLLQFWRPLMLAGACGMAYAWTRSPIWSVVAGLLMLWNVGEGYGMRESLFVLVAAATLEILHRDRRGGWLWLALLGLPCCFAGFDLMFPYLGGLAGLVLAELMDVEAGGSRRIRLAGAVGLPVLAAMLFSCVVAVWQGSPAAGAYWQIFLDYSRHYSAFYGLPLADLASSFFLSRALMGLGIFAVGGFVCSTSMRPARRRQWAFMFVATALFCIRGLGRSDSSHMSAVMPLVHVLWWVIFFEAARRLAYVCRVPSRRVGQFAGLMAIVWLGWTTRGSSSDPVTLWTTLRGLPSAETLPIEPDPRVQERVSAEEFLWPVEDGIENYANRRRNPTRHALAYCIGSPKEQRRASRDLREHRTPVILWQWWDVDGIDGLVRHYPISMEVLRRYRPSADESADSQPLAVLADPDWRGTLDIPHPFVRSQRLQRLPLAWGTHRWPRLEPKIVSQQPLESWQHSGGLKPDVESQWECAEIIDPSSFNYLRFELTGHRESGLRSIHQVQVEFAAGERYDPAFMVAFDVPADGERHSYLVPIGCHPGWTWSPQITRIRLRAERGGIASFDSATACEIDETTPD